ncbi:MAG: AAA family ATPase [Candidatus Aenigmarchaeota archaeon]|nr:AAA family ATPase [Candidatus Aenigmarchaeota archaeon]
MLIAIVGMPGAGKTEAAEYLVKKGFQFVRLGQLTLDEVKKRGLAPTEANERPIREEIRRKHGMDAFAKLNFPKIDALLKKNDVAVDGLYSWEEFLAFKKKYPDIIVIAVYASPKTRYERLAERKWDKRKDPEMKSRSHTKEEAASRDRAQLENLHSGPPIAMADFTILNECSLKEMRKAMDEILRTLNGR